MISKSDWIMVAVMAALIFAICAVSVRYRDQLRKHSFEEFEKYDGFKKNNDK